MSGCRPTGSAPSLGIVRFLGVAPSLGLAFTILVTLIATLIATPSPAATSLEFEAPAGFPASIAATSYRTSPGAAFSLLSRRSNGVQIGFHASYVRFTPESDSGGARSFVATLLQLRLPIIDGRQGALFVNLSSGLYTRVIRFSDASRLRNHLLPSQDATADLGLTLGTGLAWPLGDGPFRLTSNQTWTVIPTDVQTTQLLALSLGVGLTLD